VSQTTGIYTLYDDEIQTGGGLGFIPGGENQSIDLRDASSPRQTINQIRYTWNGQDVTNSGTLQHLFAGFSFTITPDFTTYATAQPKNLNASGANYSTLKMSIRGSLSSDTYLRIEGPDDGSGGTTRRESIHGSAGDFSLTNNWQEITIPDAGSIPAGDFNSVKTYFTISFQFIQPIGTTAAGNGGTIYLDNIRFD